MIEQLVDERARPCTDRGSPQWPSGPRTNRFNGSASHRMSDDTPVGLDADTPLAAVWAGGVADDGST